MQSDLGKLRAAFAHENLEIIDEEQLLELMRWQTLDFVTLPEILEDHYISQQELIIIMGCGRSGTTLLRVLLDSHSQIYAGPESLLFLPLETNLSHLSNKFEIAIQELQELQDRSVSRSHFIELFQNKLLSQSPKTIWADKTARNTHVLAYILAHFPNSKLIHVIRDPRDVIASLRTHRKRKLQDGQIVPTGYIMPIELCTQRWLLSMKVVLPFRGLSNYYEVRYEDLVYQTETVLQSLCCFLDCPFEQEMLQFAQNRGSTRNAQNFIQNIEATRPVFTDSIGRYRRIFSEAEIHHIETNISKIAYEFGYEIESPKLRKK